MAGVTTAGDANKNDWETPWTFIRGVESWFGKFSLDVCATDGAQKAARWFNPATDGLLQQWDWTCWSNPPWGRGLIEPWVDKAVVECERRATTRVAMLLPVKSEQRFWYTIEQRADLILKVHGRQRFVGASNGVNYATALVVFDKVQLHGISARHGRIDRYGLPIVSEEQLIGRPARTFR